MGTTDVLNVPTIAIPAALMDSLAPHVHRHIPFILELSKAVVPNVEVITTTGWKIRGIDVKQIIFSRMKNVGQEKSFLMPPLEYASHVQMVCIERRVPALGAVL